MSRRLKLALNKFDPEPATLSEPEIAVLQTGEVLPHGPLRLVKELKVELGEVFHHLHIESFGTVAPDPNPLESSYATMLASDPFLRFAGSLPGSSTESRREQDAQLGRAFCRWFLGKYLGIPYVAHISGLGDEGLRLESGSVGNAVKLVGGDAPDYLVANRAGEFFLAEAKARRNAVGFESKRFQKWRDQFDYAQVFVDNQQVAVKGFISFIRIVNDNDSPKIKPTLAVEDPTTFGERRLKGKDSSGVADAIAAVHYAGIMRKLRFPAVASALSAGNLLPDDYVPSIPLWEGLAGAVKGRKFVGGYYPPEGMSCSDVWYHHLEHPWPHHSACLTYNPPVFFGLEYQTFERLRAAYRRGRRGLAEELREPEFGGSVAPDLSTLSDGSVLGAMDYFRYSGMNVDV